MTEVYWRTTQAAAELGISPHHLRKICDAHLVEAERTEAGQWRIPVQEVNRLKKEGVPPIPVGAEPQPKARQAAQNGRTELLAPPTDAAAAAVEEVVITDAQLKVTRNKVERLKLKRDAMEVGDYFRGRQQRQADEEAARQQQERQEQEERQREIQRQQAAEERRYWRDRWIRYAQNSRPSDAPETIALDIVGQVERVLAGLDPSRDYAIVERQVDAAIESAVAPWKAEQDKQEAIEYALRYEPAFYEPQRNRRARDAAEEAIARMRPGTSLEEMKAATSAAVEPFKREYEHARKCQEIVSAVWSQLRGETAEEREEAKEAVRAALENLPVGASDRLLEQARDRALEPLRAKIATRQEQERRQGEARQRQESQAEAKRQAERRADWRVSHVSNYVRELEQDGEITFDGIWDQLDFNKKLTERIRGEVVSALVKNPDLSDEDVEDLIEELVDEHKHEFLD